jgi:hypothetical protein
MKKLLLPVIALAMAGCSPREAAPVAPTPAAPAAPASAPAMAAAPAAPAVAKAEPPTPESIERLLDLTQAHNSYDAMIGQVRQIDARILAQAAARNHLTPAQRATLTTQAEKLFAESQSNYAWDKIKPTYIRVYSASFSQEDVNTIIAFYESPVGRTFISKLTSSVQKSGGLLRTQLFQILQKTNIQVEAMAAQLAKPASTASPATPASPAPTTAKPAQPAPAAAHSP